MSQLNTPRKSVSLLLLFGAAVFPLAATTGVAANEKPSLTCIADRSRSLRIEGGDWDDKTEKIQFDLSIRNNSMSKPTGELSALFFVIGEDASERKRYKLPQKEEMSFSLEARGLLE